MLPRAKLRCPLVLLLLAGVASAAIRFEDVSASSGIGFVLQNAATPEKHQIETMAGGVAAFDYDSDGLVDLFFANGARQPDLRKAGRQWWNRLYRNRGGGRFEDVTEAAGLAGEGYSMGAAAGDYDNDGHTDLLVLGVRRNILYRNNGDGTFSEAARAGIAGEPWSIAAGFLDYDNDGHLDLFVVNYVHWDPAREPFCGDPRGHYRTYCHPKFYQGLANRLYRNKGGGTFEDVSAAAGIAAHAGKGMSAAFADFDGDGRIDIAVTNDTEADFLFRNNGDGTFTEQGLTAGIAYNDEGRALSSMGLDFRDIDGDGQPDLFITALANETFPFYRNLGKGLFADATYLARIGAGTLRYSGWGAGIYDFDNDGRRDLFAANGDVNDNAEVYSSTRSRQECLVLRQAARGRFEAQPVSSPSLHRGAAFADFDNDGLVDVAVSRIGGKPLILRNTSQGGGNWLGLALRGRRSNRDAVGARVRVGTQWNHVSRAVGYASSSDARVHFGLGGAAEAEVEIVWPSGRRQSLGAVRAGRYISVVEPD